MLETHNLKKKNFKAAKKTYKRQFKWQLNESLCPPLFSFSAWKLLNIILHSFAVYTNETHNSNRNVYIIFCGGQLTCWQKRRVERKRKATSLVRKEMNWHLKSFHQNFSFIIRYFNSLIISYRAYERHRLFTKSIFHFDY